MIIKLSMILFVIVSLPREIRTHMVTSKTLCGGSTILLIVYIHLNDFVAVVMFMLMMILVLVVVVA